jgi:hypothetical protein
LDRIVAGLERVGVRLADDPLVADDRVPVSSNGGGARG